MPLSYDEWLQETYGNEPEVVDDGGPAPFAPGEEVSNPVDSDISAFVGGIAEPLVEGNVPGNGPVPEGQGQEIQFTPQEAEADRIMSAGGSVSSSGSGYNFSPEKTQQVKAGFTNQVDARNAQSEADIYGEANQVAEEYRRVADAQKANASTRAGLDIKKAALQHESDVEEADLIRDLNFQEKLGYEEARLKEDAAMTNWVGAMKAYEASNINPGKLWGDMTGGERFGTAISVFAHNVLAAKGINTSTMSSLNKAIDDNLNSQLQNMEKKGKVAGQFKQVYDAVRSQSESEAETRMKMRALMMSEFRAGVTARLSSMDSDYAKLKAQEWAVGIEQELVKNMTDLRQVYRQNFERDREYNRTVMYNEAQLRLEKSADARAWRAQKLAEDAAKGGELDTEAIDKRSVYDTSPGGESEVYLALDEKDAPKLRTDIAANNVLISELKKFQAEAKELYSGVGSKYFDDATAKQLRAKHSALVARVMKQWSGLAYTDKQEEFMKQMLPLDTMLTANAVNRTVGDLIDRTVEENKVHLQQRARRASPVVKDYALGVRITDRDDKFQEADRAVGKELSQDIKPGQTPVDKLIGDAEADNKWDAEFVDEEANKIWEGAGFEPNTMKVPGRGTSFKQVPKWATIQMELSDYVKNQSNPTEERLKALTYLRDKAFSEKRTFGKDEVDLAWYIWEDLGSNGYLDEGRFEE